MNLARIRGFLLQLPKPAKIRVTAGDGEPQEIKPGRSYARTAETIEALGVDVIECFDKDGALLRALRLSEPEARRSDAADIPKGIEVDPSALMLTHFANLLHRAYEHSTEIAFTRLVELAERLSAHTESIEARLAHAESALRREQSDRIDDAFERAQEAIAKGDGSDPLAQQMIGAFLSARMGGEQPPAPSKSNGAKPNGKA
ncbi:MAG TPA: hypothetical protein VLB72_10050 [Burkholderiales bacterium]|nr:hypothetical protein [Burkholderiales bacterium]